MIVYMRFRDVWLWWVCASCGGCGQLCGESVAVDDFNVIVGVRVAFAQQVLPCVCDEKQALRVEAF